MKTLAKVGKPRREAYAHAETKTPVAMVEGHTQSARLPLSVISLANSSGA